MKKYWGTVLFFVFLGIVSILNVARQGRGPEILDRESRRVTPWPEWNTADFLSGAWARGMEDAFADRFLFRDKGLAAASWIDGLKGISPEKARLVEGGGAYMYAGDPEGAASIPEDLPENPPGSGRIAAFGTNTERPEQAAEYAPEFSPPMEIEKSPSVSIPPASSSAAAQAEKTELWTSKVLIYENRGYETAWYTDFAADYYANAVAHLAARTGCGIHGEGPRMYVMIIPSAIEFLQNEKYRSLSYPQQKGIRDIYAKLPACVTPINVLPELAAHSGEYIYYKTDHHWTGLGAWYAYKAAAETLGAVPFPYEAYPKENIPGFLGTMYNRTRAAELSQNPDTVELVYPFMDHVFTMKSGKEPVYGRAVDKAYIQGFNVYLSYINGDYPHSEISAGVKNGLKILILKDSYANAFIPYLIPYFEEIHIIDPRYWIGSVPSYMKEHGITDVLIFNYYLVVSVYVGFASNLLRVTGE